MRPSDGELLRMCRAALGDPPRQLQPDEVRHFALRPSLLMRFVFLLHADKLRLILREQHHLRDHGRVVWGRLVQANNDLFQPWNRQVLPANVIYSPDPFFDDRVPLLDGLAAALFELKGTRPRDREMRRFAAAITNETARTMRLRLPPFFGQDKDVFLTTCLIQPTHLPTGRLALGVFPLVICPEKTDAIMILPCRYWPEELCERWKAADG